MAWVISDTFLCQLTTTTTTKDANLDVWIAHSLLPLFALILAWLCASIASSASVVDSYRNSFLRCSVSKFESARASFFWLPKNKVPNAHVSISNSRNRAHADARRMEDIGGSAARSILRCTVLLGHCGQGGVCEKVGEAEGACCLHLSYLLSQSTVVYAAELCGSSIDSYLIVPSAPIRSIRSILVTFDSTFLPRFALVHFVLEQSCSEPFAFVINRLIRTRFHLVRNRISILESRHLRP